MADLLLIALAAMTLFSVVVFGWAALRKDWKKAKRFAGRFTIVWAIYLAVLIGVSLASPGRTIAFGETLAVDHWCLTVESARAGEPPSSSTNPRGVIVIVELRVSNSSLRTKQRARDARITLIDAEGYQYDCEPRLQKLLDQMGDAGPPLSTSIPPGGSFKRTLVYRMPREAKNIRLVLHHGAFPGVLIIGDSQSLLHRPTTFELGIADLKSPSWRGLPPE